MFALPLGEVNRQKVKLTKMALNHLQEPRDIKIRHARVTFYIKRKRYMRAI